MYMKALLCSLIIQLLGSHEVLLSDVPWDLQWQGETTFLDVVAATFRLTPCIEEDNLQSADKIQVKFSLT